MGADTSVVMTVMAPGAAIGTVGLNIVSDPGKEDRRLNRGPVGNGVAADGVVVLAVSGRIPDYLGG